MVFTPRLARSARGAAWTSGVLCWGGRAWGAGRPPAGAPRLYHGAQPVVGGVAWERRPIDPVPGPRSAAEIEAAEVVAPGVLLAGPDTRVRDRGVAFAESAMAGFLG